MRSLARQLYRDKKGMVAAMMLGFAGAVEQNLLGYSVPKYAGRRSVVFNTRLVGYLERWLSDAEKQGYSMS